MKKGLKILGVVVCVLLSVNVSYGQSGVNAKRMEVYMKVAVGDTTNLFGDTLFHSHTRLNGSMIIVLNDTSDISTLHVKLGTSQGGSDLLQKDFQYDVSGVFTDGTSYSRDYKTIRLGLGEFTGLNHYYAELQMEDGSSQSGPVYYYVK